MDRQHRAQAETRLSEAATAHGLADPRLHYRDRLRILKDTHNEAYRKAVSHHELAILPALAGDDPLTVWIEYGRFLGTLTSDGTITAVDANGRARNYAPPVQQAELVLFIPDDDASDVLIALDPLDRSDAQRATIDLLVHRLQSIAGDTA